MAIFPWHKYPYTNFEELNLDYILETVKKDHEHLEDFIEHIDNVLDNKAEAAVDEALENYNLDTKIQERIDALLNTLAGKVVNIWGDSLSLDNRWPSYLAAAGASKNNFSTNGFWLSDRVGQTGMATRIEGSVGSDSSAVINVLAIGTNDWRNQVTPGAKGNGDKTTLFGAMDAACQALISKYPNAINVFCIPPRCGSAAAPIQYTQQYENRGLADIATYYGFVIIDLFNGLPNYNPNYNPLRQKWSPDYVHPDPNYVATWAAYVIEHLATLTSDALPTNYGGVVTALTSPLSGVTFSQSRFTLIEEGVIQVNIQVDNIPSRGTVATAIATNVPAMLHPYTNTPLVAMARFNGDTYNKPVVVYAYQNSLYLVSADLGAINNLWISGTYQLKDFPHSVG